MRKFGLAMLLAACGAKAQPQQLPIANVVAPPDASVLDAEVVDAEVNAVTGVPINRIQVRVIVKPSVRRPPEAARLFLRVDWTGGSSEQFDARRYNGEFADFKVVVPQAGDATLTAIYDQDGTLSTKQPGDLLGAMHITIPASGLELRVDVPR
jgi:predicted small lipoprotein YifL